MTARRRCGRRACRRTTRLTEPSSGPMKAIWAACRSRRACAGVGAAPPVRPARKSDLQHLAEGEAEADERAERADVEQRHDPGVACAAAPRRIALGLAVWWSRLSMKSAAPTRGDGDQRRGRRRRRPRVRRLPTRGDDEQADELDDRDADVAAAGVEPERPALEPLRVEGVDVRHRRGEVAAADAGERRDEQERRVASARVDHAATSVSTVGIEQQQRADDRPVAAAERGPAPTCRAAAARRRRASARRRGGTCRPASMP